MRKYIRTQKMMKKIITILVAMFLFLSYFLVPMVNVHAEDTMYQLTIDTRGSGSGADVTGNRYGIYQVAVTFGEDGVYMFHEDFWDFTSDTFVRDADSGMFALAESVRIGRREYPAGTTVGPDAPQGLAGMFASALIEWADSVHLEPRYTTNGGGTVTVPEGMYLIREIEVGEGQDPLITTRPVLVPVHENTVATIKDSVASLEKFVNRKKESAFNIGEPYTIDLETTLPAYSTTGNVSIGVTLSDGWPGWVTFLGLDTVTVTLDGEEIEDYTEVCDITMNRGPGFVVSIHDDIVSGGTGSEFILSYQAMLNENAPIASLNAGGGTAKLTFPTAPGSETYRELTDSIRLYTYAIRMQKDDPDREGFLRGTQFTLLQDGVPIKVVKEEGYNFDRYRPALPSEMDDALVVITTGTTGFGFYGLGEGNFALHETKPRPGYMALLSDVTFTITGNRNNEGILYGGAKISNVPDFVEITNTNPSLQGEDALSITVNGIGIPILTMYNYQTSIVPMTGEKETIWLSFFGLLFLCSGVFLSLTTKENGGIF